MGASSLTVWLPPKARISTPRLCRVCIAVPLCWYAWLLELVNARRPDLLSRARTARCASCSRTSAASMQDHSEKYSPTPWYVRMTLRRLYHHQSWPSPACVVQVRKDIFHLMQLYGRSMLTAHVRHAECIRRLSEVFFGPYHMRTKETPVPDRKELKSRLDAWFAEFSQVCSPRAPSRCPALLTSRAAGRSRTLRCSKRR